MKVFKRMIPAPSPLLLTLDLVRGASSIYVQCFIEALKVWPLTSSHAFCTPVSNLTRRFSSFYAPERETISKLFQMNFHRRGELQLLGVFSQNDVNSLITRKWAVFSFDIHFIFETETYRVCVINSFGSITRHLSWFQSSGFRFPLPP